MDRRTFLHALGIGAPTAALTGILQSNPAQASEVVFKAVEPEQFHWASGDLEDLSDMIYQIVPDQVPDLTNVWRGGKKKLPNTYG